MKRLLRILVAAALTVVLMATSVSPAFAAAWWKQDPDDKYGYGGDEPRYTGKSGYVFGYACGAEVQGKKEGEYSESHCPNY
jgi:hypothetical protein